MRKESNYTDSRYEIQTSIIQNLTFNYISRLFNDSNIKLRDNEQKTLGFINNKGLYTNLAYLLSDQYPSIFKMAVFQDETRTVFTDMKQTNQGCVIQQLEQAMDFLSIKNKVFSKIVSIKRIEHRDYPNEVLRECLINSIIHRSYELNGSNLISIYSNRIDFVSLGRIVKKLEINDLKLGVSFSRNPLLLSIFFHLGYVEAYGTGIPRIFEIYKGKKNMPEIILGANTFYISIPKDKLNEDYHVIM